VLYDFSNTIFSISILSYFFPLWLGDELGAGAEPSTIWWPSRPPGRADGAGSGERRGPSPEAATLPRNPHRARGDLHGEPRLYGGRARGSRGALCGGDVCYQSTLVFYSVLLRVVSARRGAGRISGYGTAAGYIGTIFALIVLTFFVAEQTLFGATFGGPEEVRDLLGPLGGWISTFEEPNSNAFIPTAVLYLLFSLPAFLFVPDKAVREPRPVRLKMAYKSLFTTARNMRAYAGLGTFMVSTVLYTDAANTAIANMSLYGRQVFGMEQAQIQSLLLFSTIFAGVGSVAFGFASDSLVRRRPSYQCSCSGFPPLP
jgi:UMF1 family MFS transporter